MMSEKNGYFFRMLELMTIFLKDTSIPTKIYENGSKLMKNINSCNAKNCNVQQSNCSLRHSNILYGSINDLIF